MFRYIPLKEQVMEERRKNAALKALLDKNSSVTLIIMKRRNPIMSNKFEKVKSYYERGMWDISRVRNAVVKGWITAEEFFMITDEIYGE